MNMDRRRNWYSQFSIGDGIMQQLNLYTRKLQNSTLEIGQRNNQNFSSNLDVMWKFQGMALVSSMVKYNVNLCDFISLEKRSIENKC